MRRDIEHLAEMSAAPGRGTTLALGKDELLAQQQCPVVGLETVCGNPGPRDRLPHEVEARLLVRRKAAEHEFRAWQRGYVFLKEHLADGVGEEMEIVVGAETVQRHHR